MIGRPGVVASASNPWFLHSPASSSPDPADDRPKAWKPCGMSDVDQSLDKGRRRLPGRGGADYTEGPVAPHLLRLAGFMVMGFLSMNIAQLIEAVYLGFVGTEDLAALGFAFPLVMGVGAMARGLGIGASSVIARTMGAGDRSQVARLVTHCEILVVAFSLLCVVLGFAYGEQLFAFMGADGLVLVKATGYLDVYLIGLPLFLLSMVGTSLLRATGSPASPGLVMTFGSIMQVVISPFFIFGWAGLPAMGVVGAAWGFALARTASFVLAFYLIAVRDRLIVISLDNIGVSWRAILHVGLPAMTTNMLTPLSMGIIVWLLSEYGHGVIAGFNVAGRIEMMLAMVLISVSGAIGPFVGQNWGAGKFDRVEIALGLSFRFCIAWGAFGFIVMLLAARPFVGLINDDPVVVESAVAYLVIIPLSIGFMGWLQAASSVFNALGKPAPPLILSILRGFVVYLPFAMLGSYLLDYRGIYWAAAATNFLLGVVAWQWCRVTVARAIAVETAEQVALNPGKA